MTRAEQRALDGSLRLALVAVDRCRELLIIADADADDLAEYDAARMGLHLTIDAYFAPSSATPVEGDKSRDEQND